MLENEETDEEIYYYSMCFVDKKDTPLYYIQMGIEYFDFTVSSNGERIEKVDVKNKQGYWVKDTDGWNKLLYVKDGYVYMLSGHENIENLISILEKNKKIK